MTPRQLLACAHRLLIGPEEADWRAAVSRDYYAAFHATGAFFRSLRFRVPPDGSAHNYLTERLQNAQEAVWVEAGNKIHDLRRIRNEADYDLAVSFGVAWAESLLHEVDDYFDLLDQLRADSNWLTAVQAMVAHEQSRGAVTYFGPP